MNNLWRKESDDSNAFFVNLFEAIDTIDAKKWNQYLQTLKLTHNETSTKDNQQSNDLLRKGNRQFQKKQFCHAMELYTKALCFAEPGTVTMSMAFEKRASSFFRMKMYNRALIDIELAVATKCSSELTATLGQLKSDCRKLFKPNPMETPEPLPIFKADKNFPSIVADTLAIANNKQFGRHLIAKCDIDVGQLILMEDSFAAIAKTDEQMTCYTCLREMENFIACPSCCDVVFCNVNCMNMNLVHKFDCNTLYHRFHHKAKFTIQTILIAISAFSNIDDLMACVNNSREDNDDLPESIADIQSKYRLYLKLQKLPLNESVIFDVYRLFKSIMCIPLIEHLFDSEGKQRFLAHLVLHHLAINVTNATESELTASIGNILSLFNHSCAPNVYNYSVENRKFGVTVRPIKKGQQVFISYLGTGNCHNAIERKHLLKSKWNFECKCDLCEPCGTITDSNKMRLDPCFKFVNRNFKNDQPNMSIMKKKCIHFIRKYGHLPFSREMKFISDIFTSLI
ncbi:histone-lysine N-methyltransferase ASHR1-like [Contarinia nasturtii]|uniref:histone-lysine N-methyltransferase ASHR1-like n=1 Tax=Contarinia nasturtii TaxID=265458 RepID=UPI0012D4BAAA|nr:histone-lysine N-methyltransferase ASHR1-like [Contarinia nasturtii]